MKKIFIFLFVLLQASSSFAQNKTSYQLKLVFPFGEAERHNASICPIQYRTLDGCCDGAQENIYTSNNRKGCCRSPNEFLKVGAGSACCTALPTGQNRWGQTFSSVCGGHCPPPSEIRSFQTFNSCCDECNPVSGVVAFQAKGNVCGTCCSRIPESCGNAGIRLCSEGTGSAYCSKLPDKCNDPDDWLIGSHGEGGFTCCSKCGTGGVRYASTNSDCGSCCYAPDLKLTYGGATSCCTELPTGQTRWGQTTSSVCGGYCAPTSSIYSFNGLTSCCSSCNEVIAFQSNTNVCGTCCSRIPESCGNVGVRVCEPGSGSAYCSIDPAKPCSGDGYYVTGSSGEGGYNCLYKSNPCGASGSWYAGTNQWHCPFCTHESLGIINPTAACIYAGASANNTCTAVIGGVINAPANYYSCFTGQTPKYSQQCYGNDGCDDPVLVGYKTTYHKMINGTTTNATTAAANCRGLGHVCNANCVQVIFPETPIYSCGYTTNATVAMLDKCDANGACTNYYSYTTGKVYVKNGFYQASSLGNCSGKGYVCDENCNTLSFYSCSTGWSYH